MSLSVAAGTGFTRTAREATGGVRLPRWRDALVALIAVAALVAAMVPALSVDNRAGVQWTAPAATPAPTAAGDGATASVDPGLVGATGEVSVIVQARPGSAGDARAAAEASGAVLGADLPIVDGFEAKIAAEQIEELARSGAIHSITLNRTGRFDTITYDEATTASNFVRTTGASAAWARGKHGDGVGIAVIDTGISPMNDLKGRIVHGPDLSGEGSVIDSYGHGTVMAGLIGGNGADSATASGGVISGVAPKSTLVSVKVAGRNGSVDVSTILQAFHWVSAYASQYNVRVINLSWGVSSTQHPQYDPLNYAVQRLWGQGIVVVVAAGNSGPQSGTVTKPADDPMVITVGALDDKQNTDPADDSIAAWSSQGPTAQGVAKPDLVAPGRLLISQRSFGSKVEADYPKALRSPSYIRGSGTSQAAAVASGAVALLLQARPELTPDQVKAILKSTASPLAGANSSAQGSGRLQLGAALDATAGAAQWQVSNATGLGSIDASRGAYRVETTCPQDNVVRVIQGEMDVRCEQWDPQAWTGTAWTGTAWTGTAWTGTAWTGTAWTGQDWQGTAWTGTAWTGGNWQGSNWQGTAWTGTAWTGTAWTGTAWTGTAWTGTAWTGSNWQGTAWTGTAWTGTAWTTGEYDEFLAAFWGDRTRSNNRLPGELIDGFTGRLLPR